MQLENQTLRGRLGLKSLSDSKELPRAPVTQIMGVFGYIWNIASNLLFKYLPGALRNSAPLMIRIGQRLGSYYKDQNRIAVLRAYYSDQNRFPLYGLTTMIRIGFLF